MDKSKILGISFFILIFVGIGIVVLVKHFVETYDPILDFLPKPDQYSDSSLIWISREDDMNESPWEDQLTNFIREYSDSSTSQTSGQICTFENGKVASKEDHCNVDVQNLVLQFSSIGSHKFTKFGYIGGGTSPSIVLTLRTMDGWMPEPFTREDLQQAEELMMPVEYRELIRNLDSDQMSHILKQRLNSTWISCEGVTLSDQENIRGNSMYFYVPGFGTKNYPGIPNYYFPYLKQPGYQIPFLIVQFVNLPVNVLISVECRAWAKNIGPEEHRGFAKVEFELLID